MSMRWETLVGDTRKFAMRIGFLDDESNVAMEPDVAASWGSFELWVEGKNVCAHVEQDETLDGVHWYLLPLIEWFVDNWNPLLHEERLPISNAADNAVSALDRTRFAAETAAPGRGLEIEQEWYDWRQRHGIHAAREGGLFPELYLRRWEDKVEVSWSSYTPPGAPTSYSFLVPSGHSRLATEDVAQPLHQVLTGAVDQLCSWRPDSERLLELGSRLAGLKKPGKQRAERLAWLFNLRVDGGTPASAWPTVQRLFSKTSSRVRRSIIEPEGSGLALHGSSHAVLLFGSVSPEIKREDAQVLADLLISAFNDVGDTQALADLVDAVTSEPLEGLPWEQGYELADRTHHALCSAEGPVDIASILDALGVHVGEIGLSDGRLRGIALAGPQHQPTIIRNSVHPRNQSVAGQRFTYAHEFCHLLVDRSIGMKLAVASGQWAPVSVEQRANAFAAYFLMPLEQLQDAIAELAMPLNTLDGIRTVAETLATSPRATLEHLYNVGLIDEYDRDVLRGTGLDEGSFGRPITDPGG